MKYIELTIHTTTEASEIISDIMWNYTDYGVTICDRADIIALQTAKESTFWDYMDDELEEIFEILELEDEDDEYDDEEYDEDEDEDDDKDDEDEAEEHIVALLTEGFQKDARKRYVKTCLRCGNSQHESTEEENNNGICKCRHHSS